MAHPFARQAQTLKQKLQTATDIAEPWNYFHDSLVHLPRFLEMGVQKDNPDLWRILGGVAVEVLHEPIPLIGERFLLHLRELHLWHGTTFVAGRPLVVFYFDDIDKGVAGILHGLGTMRSSLFRFSLVRVPEGAMPMLGLGRA